ncbi:MAG TPA: phage tail tape measure protein [Variovorax sp.]
MRELKLRYFIDLVSNVGAKAQAEAKALEAAQKVMTGAITGTNNKLTDWNALSAKTTKSAGEMQAAITGTTTKFTEMDRVLDRVGRNTSTQRQANYMRQLATSADEAEKRVKTLHQRLATGWRAGIALGSGALAAGRAVSGDVKDAMGYDRLLAGMANTAYADQGAAGRIAGMKTLEKAVDSARKAGGGGREQAAGALDTMIASGTVSVADAMTMLPGVTKASTASGAGSNELATIGIRANQSFHIPASELPSLLSAAMVAGQAGGFELKDMAKWLPQQMAMAKNLGISGKEGFAKLTAWNQASVITAGTKDEAGNNLRDLLNELNTPHFRDFMAKELLNGGKALKKGGKLKQQQKIDDIFLDYQSRGVDKVSATIELLDKHMAADPKYAALQKKLRTLPKDDLDGRASILEAMSAQVQGTNTGKIFHNQQSLMAFLALSNNREYTSDVLSKVREEYNAKPGQSAVDVAHIVIASTADYKVEQGKEDARKAEKAATDKFTPSIGSWAEKFSQVVSSNPETAGTTLLAAKAAAAFSAVSAGLWALLRGGGSAAPAGAGAAATATTATSLSRAGMLARGASAFNPLMLLELLTGPSEEDIAKLRAMDREKAGYRGRGFDDPRRLDRPAPDAGSPTSSLLAPRLGSPLAVPQVDFLTLTAPGVGTSTPLQAGQTTEVKVGDGRLVVDLRVTDDRVLALPSVTQQPSLVKIDAGGTNPGGFRK